LAFGDSFNQDLSEVDLSNVTHLAFGGRFNKYIVAILRMRCSFNDKKILNIFRAKNGELLHKTVINKASTIICQKQTSITTKIKSIIL